MNQAAIGSYIAKKRREKNLTQEQLAETLGVSNKTISKWENGKGYPAIDSLKLLSSVYGVSLDELISDDDVIAAQNAKKRRSRIFYWCAVACLIAAALFAVTGAAVKVVWLFIPSAIAVAGYVTFGFLTNRRVSGMSRAEFVRFIVCRAIVLAIVVAALITTFLQIFG